MVFENRVLKFIHKQGMLGLIDFARWAIVSISDRELSTFLGDAAGSRSLLFVEYEDLGNRSYGYIIQQNTGVKRRWAAKPTR